MSNDLAKYIAVRPQSFDPHRIIAYLDALDKKFVRSEIDHDEVKDQVQEVFDYVVNEKMTNESLSVSLAKVKATNDERYKKVKKELSDKKKIYLYCKIEAKNGHSYCDNLKQQSINFLATEKLTRN
jgi:Na+-translocating ferredoxin:NAD+ oxidoreductase RnfG subunit